MKKTLTIFLSFFVMVGCTTPGLFVDDEYGVSFNYPEHWQTREVENSTMFSLNLDYLDGTDDFGESTSEGVLIYYVLPNSDGLSLQEYYDEDYQKCMGEESPVAVDADVDFGPMCENLDFTEWSQREIDGNISYESDWKGISESGEMQKRLLIDLKDKNIFVVLSAIKTGTTDEGSINETSKNTFDSVGIK